MSPQAHCFPSPPCVHCLRKFTGHPGRWEGGTRRGGEQGPGCRWAEAQPPVVALGCAVRHGGLGQHCRAARQTCRERVLGVLSTRKKRFFPFCVCERWRVFARAAVHGAVSGGVSPGVGTAQGGSPPAAAAPPRPRPARACVFLGSFASGGSLHPRGTSWQRWPQAPPSCGQGGGRDRPHPLRALQATITQCRFRPRWVRRHVPLHMWPQTAWPAGPEQVNRVPALGRGSGGPGTGWRCPIGTGLPSKARRALLALAGAPQDGGPRPPAPEHPERGATRSCLF